MRTGGTRASGPGRLADAARDTARRLVQSSRGQAFSEYLTLSGVIVVIVVASMAAFTTPVARTFAALFRRLVVSFTSPS